MKARSQKLFVLIKLASVFLVAFSLNACAARAVVGAGRFAAKTAVFAAKTTVKTGATAVRATSRTIGAAARAVTN